MQIKYRPEVDGLRAVAVLAVILYHADLLIFGKNPFGGGFVGVDVFFVISGYLITSIILTELDKDSFSILRFYERRARRILPLLLVVILATIPFAWLLMLPDAMDEYSGSGLSALLFSSNFWFWLEDSYWAEPSELKPLLHTWSLSVEEQFYLVYPPLLLLVTGLARKKSALVLAVLGLSSLLFAEYFTAKSPEFTFYLMPARGWELLAGAVLAVLEIDVGRKKHKYYSAFMPAIGLGLITYSVVWFSPETKHPSVLTLIPVAGTSLLIWFTEKDELVTKILSHRFVVGIGLISYGLYMWHYPIFAFALMNNETPSQADKVGWILAAALFSIASYYLVEKPFRRGIKNKLVFFSIITTLLIALTSFMSFGYFTERINDVRMKGAGRYIPIRYWKDEETKALFYTHPQCWLSREEYETAGTPFQLCESFETLDGGEKILVVGDSNIAGLIPGLINRYGRDRIIQRVVNGCLPGRFRESENDRTDICNESFDHVYETYAKHDIKHIIVGGRYRSKEHVDRALIEISTGFAPDRDKIIIFGPVPRYGEGGRSNIVVSRLLRIYFSDERERLFSRLDLKPDPLTFELDSYAREKAAEHGYKYLSPVAILCNVEEGTCMVKQDASATTATTWDYGHLTEFASKLVIEQSRELLD